MSEHIGMHDLSYTQNRELSWLKFNARVLEEAQDPTVPLLERLKFISIFTSNLDEFFMVRVGSLFDLSVMTPRVVENKSGKTPRQQLDLIYDAVRPMIRSRDAAYAKLLQELKAYGVEDIPFELLEEKQRGYIRQYYKENIRPLLSPQIIDPRHPFPHLKNKALYAAALLRNKNHWLLGIVAVPDSVPDILRLPDEPGKFVRVETIVLYYLKKIFHIYTVEEQAIISVTRNADLSYDEEKFDEDNPDFRSHMSKLLRLRDRLAPVRLEMQGEMPTLRQLLLERLKLTAEQSYTCQCPLVMGYAYELGNLDKALYYPTHVPQYPSYLTQDVPMWEQIKQRDVLLFYPYHTMQPFLTLLREAALDPNVCSIQITIYRLAKNSAIVTHLCEAAERGKEVTALVELRARFDEQNNINWAKTLEDAGCRVIYGMDYFKCHSKVCLITRREKNGLSYVTQIGTGNYNEKTSAQYTDFSIMTAKQEIAQDAIAFFQNMLIGNLWGKYDHLLVAPVNMKSMILRLIDGEIARGSQGRIIIKANSVTERDLIDKLAQASQAGVKIDLIIRGICCLVPGIPGKTDHITVTSIVGRFLEHSRIYAFGDGALQQLYISSADIMTRNQTRRVEIAYPVDSPELKEWFHSYLELLLRNNTKARRLQPDGNYVLLDAGGAKVDAQDYYLQHPVELAPTVVPRKSLLRQILGRLDSLRGENHQHYRPEN